ncbi:MAG: 50S ribosomal protein L11 methyltransferase [Bacteroidales bacterium]|nr:50S ribosomal protein L11 methyltransferase [Bacteroidales bacterium]
MDYIEVSFKIEPKSTGTEILIAQLSQIGYESFQETDTGVLAYIRAKDFKSDDINTLTVFQVGEFEISFTQKLIKEQNWNEVWERNYSPVFISDKVYIRAPFHKGNKNSKYEIIIEPKMSFGTAHHETTNMMIELMLEEKFEGKSVLDIGCGTGILSILSEMLGAAGVMAIDIDEWAYNNSLENIRKNKCKNIIVQLGDINMLNGERFNFILANINRNVLLDDMEYYSKHLTDDGIIIFSGFYQDDLDLIKSSGSQFGLKFDRMKEKNNWIAARFVKV